MGGVSGSGRPGTDIPDTSSQSPSHRPGFAFRQKERVSAKGLRRVCPGS